VNSGERVARDRWLWLPIVLVSVGVAAAWLMGILFRQALGWWQLALYLAGALVLLASWWFRRQLSPAEAELEGQRRQIEDERQRLADERQQFALLQTEVREQFDQQGRQLSKREEALANRLLAFHEWMEFPQPVDLSVPHNPQEDRELAELLRQDRQLDELLKAETQILYDYILANRYSKDGVIQLTAIRDDVHRLILRVAQLYQPGVTQPLLETSLALVIRAAGRSSLHFLVLLEELPLNVKDYTLARLYGYLRNAVSAYRMYKSAEPYWPYVNTAYYLSRFALGANPLTLGAWWFIGALGQRGAQAVATRIINRQALALLANVVRVIGYEVAATYGGDFRHRHANWIYGVELTELVSRFPLSKASLSHALKEIGGLSLRSEYDRMFLYRCLAEHVSARPQQYQAARMLAAEERRAIAGRLEKFLELHIHGKAADRVSAWKTAVEERLQAKLVVGLRSTALAVEQQIEDAIESLASFLLGVKEREPPELPALLGSSKLLAALPADRARASRGSRNRRRISSSSPISIRKATWCCGTWTIWPRCTFGCGRARRASRRPWLTWLRTFARSRRSCGSFWRSTLRSICRNAWRRRRRSENFPWPSRVRRLICSSTAKWPSASTAASLSTGRTESRRRATTRTRSGSWAWASGWSCFPWREARNYSGAVRRPGTRINPP
jgi:hypothetical protein